MTVNVKVSAVCEIADSLSEELPKNKLRFVDGSSAV